MFGLFLFYVYKNSSAEILQTEIKHIPLSNKKITAYIVFGLAALVAGGQLVVSNAILIATNLGVSEQIIGLTIVAAGTSLPELATSVTAAIKKNNDIAIGNIIGSNIFNIFSILAISSFINPLVFEEKFNIDLYLLAGGTLFLFSAMFMGRKRKLDRWEAGLLLTFYVGYLIYIIQKEL
jgi:cation:H+ antiporter